MASIREPKIYTYMAQGAIAKGKAVKPGSVDGTVIIGAANTDRCIGIAQTAATASGQYLEIACFGGGAKALISETVAAGNDLVSASSGSLEKVNASGDEIIARALEAGVSGDLISVDVYYTKGLAAQ